MADINFRGIAARSGSQSNAFEELCSQLARRTRPSGSSFERFRGAGGDAGVECVARLQDGSVTGWQAKFVFDVNALITQTEKSLQTALSIHKDLSRYIVCFPFDPTGNTSRVTKPGRRAKSQSQKINDWMANATTKAQAEGLKLLLECWPANKLQSLLFEHDAAGGIREYFFSETILSTSWFKNHLTSAAKAAGPRYTPKLNVDTDLWSWFSAFEGGRNWRESLDAMLGICRQVTKRFQRQLNKERGDSADPAWPTNELQAGQHALSQCNEALRQAQLLLIDPTESGLNDFFTAFTSTQSTLRQIESRLADKLEAEHGEGTANSKSFRTYMAEHMVSYPAANLDAVRNAKTEFAALESWLRSPVGYLACNKTFVLSGSGGSGKTHGICDMAFKRLDDEAYTCVLFGHQFRGQPSEWTRLVESLGLPITIGKEVILDALNAAGEASGRPLIFCIDAVNETEPRDYWLNRFLPVAHEFERRPFLKLCVSCRTSFLSACLPKSHLHPVVEHRGFVGVERQACNAFFHHYELEPPLAPVLQSELSNPLYLKLVCETLKLRGLRHLPSGWHGLAPVIRAFLFEKEKQFASEHGTSAGAGIVAGSLLAIARAVADSGNAALPWSQAQIALSSKRPQAATLQVLEWLVRADLLIEDGATSLGSFSGESVLRPAFERFGDFLVADEMLPKTAPENFATAFTSDKQIQRLLATPVSVEANAGIVSALSIILPETAGVELPNLIKDAQVQQATIALTIRAFPWRPPYTFTDSTRDIARQGLEKDAEVTMNSIVAVSAQPSRIDAYWVSGLLASLQIAKRDAFWSGYLQDRFEQDGTVKRLIEASRDIDLKKLDLETASRWALMLLWFSTAADRRVKDQATRAAISIFRAKSEVIPPLVEKLIDVDDDELRERVMLCAYGALIGSRENRSLKTVAETLLSRYQSAPTAFQNAIIRDHIRCIGELAQQLGCLNERFDPLITSRKQKSDWPLNFPTDAELEGWRTTKGAVSYLARSCLNDDFNHYSIACLRPWMHKFTKAKIGGWILKYIVEEFAIDGGDCDNYDKHTAYTGGGGRSKPSWAERIGKKYQWIAMYRLASRLNDNVSIEESTWDPPPVRQPLILMEERKLDPTLSNTTVPKKTPSECWWLRDGVDLMATKEMRFASWVTKQDDLPLLETLLQATSNAGQRWLVLSTYPSWSEFRSDADYGTPYRDTWIQIHSYLVPKPSFRETVEALDGRNYFGEWLPEGAKWLHVFAGEYPWATACNTEPDWSLGAAEKVRDSNLELIHSTNQIVIEWEYDSTLPDSIYLEVPTKRLFSSADLWWNGIDGFGTVSGKTVFYDPHMREGGPAGLLADVDELIPRLDKLGYRLVWTMLGMKDILGDQTVRLTPLCYSQMAILNEDGSVNVRKRSFFDCDENQGLCKG
jgi:hypothetical protein